MNYTNWARDQPGDDSDFEGNTVEMFWNPHSDSETYQWFTSGHHTYPLPFICEAIL